MSKQAVSLSGFNRARRYTFGPKRLSVMKTAQMKGNMMELVGNNPDQRNWRGILIAFLVIIIVCGFVILAILLLSKEEEHVTRANVRMTDVIGETWKKGLLYDAEWIGDSLVWKDSNGNLRKMNLRGDPVTLISNYTLQESGGGSDFAVSKDFQFVLVASNKKQIYTYSYNASYLLYDVKASSWSDLLHNELTTTFQSATFGPRGNQLVYVVDGNLYYKKNVNDSASLQLTNSSMGILNGIANMQYEEEIFKRSKSHWFSPDGRYLAYARFDDTKVSNNYVISYVSRQASQKIPISHPKIDSFPYSKAGERNALVTVFVRDLDEGTTVELERPLELLSRERLNLLHSVAWSPDSSHLLISWSNRNQSFAMTQQCNPDMTSCVDDILPNRKGGTDPDDKWIPYLNQLPLITTEPGMMFYILSRSHGKSGSFNHLALINYSQKPTSKKFLTVGFWEVTKLLHYSSQTRTVFYISNEPDTRGRFIYQLNIDTNVRVCLTCPDKGVWGQLSKGNGPSNLTTSECLYFDAEFGTSSEWMLLHCLGPGLPLSTVGVLTSLDANSRDTSVNTQSTSHLRFLPLNVSVPLPVEYSDHLMRMYRYGRIQIKGRNLNVKLLYPAGNHIIGHRSLVFSMGAVGDQQADFRFRLGFPEFMTSRDRVIFAFVDGSGSGYQGNQLLWSVAGKPGVAEICDIADVLSHVNEEWNINASPIGIIGEGYGGFTSIFGLAESPGNILCGVALRPIVNWNIYSSIDGERILGDPSKNSVLYQESNLLRYVNAIKSRNLLLIHGLQDHFISSQQSMLLQQAVMEETEAEEDSPVQVMYYSDPGTLTSSRASKTLLFNRARGFLKNCLSSEDIIIV